MSEVNFIQLTSIGQNFSSAEYPSDLAPLPNNPNYTTLESQGYIAVFDLTLSSSFIDDNGTIHKQGQQSQCASDNCLQIFNAIVNRCTLSLCSGGCSDLPAGQWNTHYIGGYHQKVSPCGTYSMFTLNCTNNIVNSDCSRWHSRWQPSYTTTSTSTSYSVQLYTNTDNYQFTWTNPTTTMTSGVMVSTMTGPGWTTMTPLMYTIDSTNTGWVPNPTYDGPTFSPRSSSVATTSSPTPTMTRMGQSIPIETQLAN